MRRKGKYNDVFDNRKHSFSMEALIRWVISIAVACGAIYAFLTAVDHMRNSGLK